MWYDPAIPMCSLGEPPIYLVWDITPYVWRGIGSPVCDVSYPTNVQGGSASSDCGGGLAPLVCASAHPTRKRTSSLSHVWNGSAFCMYVEGKPSQCVEYVCFPHV